VGRTIVAWLAGCVVAAGCDSPTAGRGTLAEDARPATPAPDPTTPGGTSGPGAPSPTSPAPTRPTAAAETIPAALAGTWTGIVDQPASTLPQRTAVLALPAAQASGTLTVSGACRGVVAVQAATEVQLIARTVITSCCCPGVADHDLGEIHPSLPNRSTNWHRASPSYRPSNPTPPGDPLPSPTGHARHHRDRQRPYSGPALADRSWSRADLVGVAGFEPTASSSRTKRATKLRHTPVAVASLADRVGRAPVG
jgi:hypothetical protein